MDEIEVLDGVAATTVHDHMLTATQRLLGDTIAVSDQAWRQPSPLPGWTRGHVATHVARNADGLRRLVENVLHGTDHPMYIDDRDAEIEAGADRDSLALQQDLDASASAFDQAYRQLTTEQLATPVQLRGGIKAPVAALALGRLFEVTLHHVDLALGFGIDDVAADDACWLLAWAARRLNGTGTDFSATLVPDGGAPVVIGAGGTKISGSPQALLGWLSGRASRDGVEGAGSLTPPAL